MESIVIAVPAAEERAFEQRIADEWRFRPSADGWVVEDHDRRIYLSRSDSVVQELGDERLKRINQTVAQPIFYVLDYTDIALCREALAFLSRHPGVLIDTDHGVVLSGEQLAWRLRADPEWDWRRS